MSENRLVRYVAMTESPRGIFRETKDNPTLNNINNENCSILGENDNRATLIFFYLCCEDKIWNKLARQNLELTHILKHNV